MVKPIIEAFPKEKHQVFGNDTIINVSEFFADTIQGEGKYIGQPAEFLRLQGCVLNCHWCDTLEVWKTGNPYSIGELLDMCEENELVERFRDGHLVLTGGSPLKQQSAIVEFIHRFIDRYGFKPFVEIENECVLMPSQGMNFDVVDHWTNCPKLENSGMSRKARYKFDVLKIMKNLNGIWKFVVTNPEEWNEIVNDFIEPLQLKRDEIYIMPEGSSQKEIRKNYDFVVELCCREGVKFTDRQHITIWNQSVGK